MKYSISLILILFISNVLGKTNITGVVQDNFFLISDVVETNGKLRSALEIIELPSGGIDPKIIRQISDMNKKNHRVIIISDPLTTNKVIHVLATYPFPRINGGISRMDDYVFIRENVVELEVERISEAEYRQKLTGWFIYRTNSFAERKYHEPYAAQNAPALFGNSEGFFILKDIYSFTMTRPESRPDNWYTLYNRYKTKVIIKER